MTDPARPDPQAALYAALAEAAVEAERIPKDGWNDHHKYAYTKSETIIREGRRILLERGISVIPGKAVTVSKGTQRSWDKGVNDAVEKHLLFLEREFTVCHRGGGSMPGSMSWGLDATGGKTLDKASAAAETTCFAYYLRSLLMLPRDDERGPHDQDHPSNQGGDYRDQRQSGPRSRAPARQAQQEPRGAPPAQQAPAAGTGPVVLSAKAEARVKRIAEVTTEEQLGNVAQWLADLDVARQGGEDTGFSEAEVAAFETMYRARKKELNL